MADNDKPESIGPTNDELERWRRAAEDALQQLDWAIGYLHGIGKNAEARALAANRRTIRQRVLERTAQPLPDER
jgi:histone H3/H4